MLKVPCRRRHPTPSSSVSRFAAATSIRWPTSTTASTSTSWRGDRSRRAWELLTSLPRRYEIDFVASAERNDLLVGCTWPLGDGGPIASLAQTHGSVPRATRGDLGDHRQPADAAGRAGRHIAYSALAHAPKPNLPGSGMRRVLGRLGLGRRPALMPRADIGIYAITGQSARCWCQLRNVLVLRLSSADFGSSVASSADAAWARAASAALRRSAARSLLREARRSPTCSVTLAALWATGPAFSAATAASSAPWQRHRGGPVGRLAGFLDHHWSWPSQRSRVRGPSPSVRGAKDRRSALARGLARRRLVRLSACSVWPLGPMSAPRSSGGFSYLDIGTVNPTPFAMDDSSNSGPAHSESSGPFTRTASTGRARRGRRRPPKPAAATYGSCAGRPAGQESST